MGDLVTHGWAVAHEISATLPAPPEVVWELVTDWERQGEWMLEASDFVVTSDHRAGPGVEAAATIAIAGIKTRDRIRVVGWEPGHRLAIEHLGWVRGYGEIYLTPSGPGRSHVFWREVLRPPLGIVGAIGLTLFKPLLRRAFERDVAVLGRLAASATTGHSRAAGLQEPEANRRTP